VQPAHLASGGILKALAFEDFTDTARIAEMAKSRDAAKERYWLRVIRRLEASGLGPRRFCQREGLSEHRLHWWRRTLRGRDRGQARTRRDRGAGGPARGRRDQKGDSAFIRVGLPFPVAGSIEVVHPRGHVIRIPAIFDPTTLDCILAVIDAPAAFLGEE
jgi:hypothetical protein